MDHRNFTAFLAGLSALGVGICIAVSCSDQPKVKCTAGRGRFAANYQPMTPPPDAGCSMTGEAIGVEMYGQANAEGTNVDPSTSSVYIQGDSIAQAVMNQGAPDPAHPENSIARFETAEPGADTFCDLTTPSVAEQDLPGVDGGVAGTSIKYEWKNVRFVVSPARLGSQMVGDLTYTHDSCVANYHVTALYPAVRCQIDGTALDFCKCLYYGDPNPDYHRPKGSGISPDLFDFAPAFGDQACDVSAANAQRMEDASRVKCDHVTNLCVLKGEPPQ
jgi:hypothetical protein